MNTPAEYKEYLDKHILGQQDAKKAVAVLFYSHFQKHVRQNLLLIGPSGSGKTELFRQLRNIYPNDHLVYIYDASNITNDGWSGKKKFDSVFKQMYTEGWSVTEIENAIIVFDEFDKMVAPKSNSSNENVSMSVQGELLSMVEGTAITLRTMETASEVVIHTNKISFVFLGAFEELYEKKKKEASKQGIGFGSDIKADGQDAPVQKITFTFEDMIGYGTRTELAGRISRMVVLDALTENDFYSILLDPIMSPLSKLSLQYRCGISIKTQALKQLAHDASKNGMGVRYLHGRILDAISDELYEPESSGILTLISRREHIIKLRTQGTMKNDKDRKTDNIETTQTGETVDERDLQKPDATDTSNITWLFD